MGTPPNLGGDSMRKILVYFSESPPWLRRSTVYSRGGGAFSSSVNHTKKISTFVTVASVSGEVGIRGHGSLTKSEILLV